MPLILIAVLLVVVLPTALFSTRLLFGKRQSPGPVNESLSAADVKAERMAELELRLAQPPAVGVNPLVAVVAMAGALTMVWMQRAESDYFTSDKEPIELGSEGTYHWGRAISNRYAELHGTPTTRGAYAAENGKVVVAVGIQNTPVMLWRGALPTEHWKPGGVPPRPDQRPFTARGRLLARAEAGDRFADAFQKLDSFGEVKPQWVLVESVRPGTDFGALGLTTGLLVLAAVNFWLLIRGTTSQIARRRINRRAEE